MQAPHSACYRGNIASGAVVMRSSHGPHNEDTVLLIVLIVSGALFSEVNNNRSPSGNNLLMVNNLQNSK
ncbi:hypothetical protein IUT45_002346 [Escherichia coli]|nr:hypothetical protein [Escherichia coli]EHK4202033.1 hypothetical protein [Escherichia coli]EHK4837049.1 hypothetical protein [Escherichia coli]EHK9836085.1 hypothetical protein [Escherichia coli]EHL0028638.1 hypothetical protein [Escherichia coli]